MLYKVILTFDSLDNIVSPFRMEATVQYFAVLLFAMPCKVALTYESDVNIVRPFRMEAIEQKFLNVTIQMKATKQQFPVVVYYVLQGDSNFRVC